MLAKSISQINCLSILRKALIPISTLILLIAVLLTQTEAFGIEDSHIEVLENAIVNTENGKQLFSRTSYNYEEV